MKWAKTNTTWRNSNGHYAFIDTAPATRIKLGERSFAVAGLAAWNSLPTLLHETTNKNNTTDEHKAFKSELKKLHFLNEHIVHNDRILTFSVLCYAPLVTSLCKRRTIEMTFMNYEFYELWKCQL